MNGMTFIAAPAPARKPCVYYLALIADIAKLSDDRRVAELVLDLAYGMADVMQDEAVSRS